MEDTKSKVYILTISQECEYVEYQQLKQQFFTRSPFSPQLAHYPVIELFPLFGVGPMSGFQRQK